MPPEQPSDITISIVTADQIDLAALSRLFASVGMRRRSREKMRAAISASTVAYAAFVGNRLVGFGRLISDATYYGSIWDVAVLPEVQRRGIGKKLLEALLHCARSKRLIIVGLFTARNNREFYERHGFRFHEGIHAMTQGISGSRDS